MAKTETQIETVTMQDARIVEFAGKRKLLKESIIDADGTVKVRADFRNGQTRLFTVPPAMIGKFAAHGAEQKLGDEIAGLDDVEDCVIAFDELVDRLYSGEWGVQRSSNGLAGTSVLLRALCEAYGKPADVVKAFLAGNPTANPPIPAKTQAEKLALRNNPKIKPIVERLEAEKTAKASKVDTEALLAGLEG